MYIVGPTLTVAAAVLKSGGTFFKTTFPTLFLSLAILSPRYVYNVSVNYEV